MDLTANKHLILASASPSRKMLLERAGVEFEVFVSGVEETVPPGYTPAQTVECLAQRKGEAVFHSVTQVTFYRLTEEEIAEYVAMGESRGRAGSYGIEGKGVTLVRSICGDYSNIVGLPVAETLRRLKGLEPG